MTQGKMYAIGAEWCGASAKQQEVVNGMKKEGHDVQMLMCLDKDNKMKKHSNEALNQICQAALPNMSAFPTWVEHVGMKKVADVKPLTQTVEAPVHFVQDACTLPGYKHSKCKK